MHMTNESSKSVEKKEKAKRQPLQGEVHLILHTEVAQSLFHGSWEYHKMGLLQFAKMMHTIWQAAKQGNPQAQLCLTHVQGQIAVLQEEIRQVEISYKNQLGALRGLEVDLFSNPNPERVLLRFSLPLSYMAGYLLADLDYLLRQTYTLMRLGFVLEQRNKPAIFIGKVRKVFAEGRKWRLINYPTG